MGNKRALKNPITPKDKKKSEKEKIKEDIILVSSTDKALKLLTEIKSENSNDSFEYTLKLVEDFLILFEKNQNNDELFFLLVEGITEAAKSYKESWEIDFLTALLDRLLEFLDAFQSNIDHLISLNNSILQILEVLTNYELYEELEEYVILLVNKAITKSNDLFLRGLASEACIVALRGFGQDWNYEKTKEFDIILKGLLPPNELDDFLTGILMKGLAIEIDCYGDMHEFSSMKKTLKLMNQLYDEQLDFDAEFLLYYSTGLVNSINWLGEVEEFEEIMNSINDLLRLSARYKGFLDLQVNVANGLKIALDHCGTKNNLDTAILLTQHLLSLADEFPNNKKIQSITIMGVFKAAIWAGIYWELGITNRMLKNVESIHNRFPEDQQIKVLLGRGLFNLTKELANFNERNLMLKIVGQLNTMYLKNPKIIELVYFYSQSIVNLIYMLGEFTDDFETISDYIEISLDIFIKHPNDEIVSINYAKSLVNAVRAFGMAGKIGEMETYLERLKDFEISSDNVEISLRLGKAYVDAIKIFGDIGDLERVNQIYLALVEMVEEDMYNLEIQIILAKSLVNIISAHGKNDRYSEMTHYLDMLREITILYPTVNIIQEQLVKGLTQSIRWLAKDNDLNRCISFLQELRSINNNYPENEAIQEMLARSTRRISVLAYKQAKFELVEELLDAIRKLLNTAVKNETIQIELARALSTIIIEESSQASTNFWQTLAIELKGLAIQYPENTKLIAIHEAVSPLLRD